MTEPGFRIGVVLSSRPWATQLHAYATDHSADVEVVVVRDHRAALESHLHLLVADETTPWLTTSFVAHAERAGLAIVGVWDRDEPAGEERLAALGLLHRLTTSVSPAEALFLLGRLRPSNTAARFEQIVASLGDLTTDTPATGRIVAVGGPPGAGAREVAIGVAAAWTSSAVLVDVNESSPGVARRLGFELFPHIVTAIDSTDLTTALAQPPDAAPFAAIVGLPAASEWDRLTARSVEQLLERCRTRWVYTVAVTSPIIEDLHRWVDRYGVSRHVLGTVADTVIGVCEASPRGVVRFAEWAADLTAAGRTDPPIVVINKVPRSRFALGEIIGQLQSVFAGRINIVGAVPFDKTLVTHEWNATIPTRGAFFNATRHLATAIATIYEAVRV
jgi:hypothetical protein